MHFGHPAGFALFLFVIIALLAVAAIAGERS